MHSSVTQNDFQKQMAKAGFFHPDGIKKEHIQQYLCGERKLIKRAVVIHPSSSSFGLVYPGCELLINSLQATTLGPFMPPGPTYNEREKRFALSVINTVAPFSIDTCANLVKDNLSAMLEATRGALREKKKSDFTAVTD